MGYFTLKSNSEGRQYLVDNSGRPFYSVGINHVDEANLLHPQNRHIHDAHYPTRADFVTKTVARLKDLNFNTIGWTQEYICGSWDGGGALDWEDATAPPVDLLHGAGWTQWELRHCGMPYMVQLPVMEIQDWNGHPAYRDPRSQQFRAWCEYLARSTCSVHRDSELCVGYFFVDVPGWAKHRSGRDFSGLEGLDDSERDSELGAIARSYYRTICEAIRTVDPNHLIFGDRYNGNRSIPSSVLQAMSDYVDVLSVQYFVPNSSDSERQKMFTALARWSKQCGNKPVLIADIGNWCATEHNAQRESAWSGQHDRGEDYVAIAEALAQQPWCIGWHWCGYIENLGGRGWGIIDPYDEPYEEMTLRMANVNGWVIEAVEQS